MKSERITYVIFTFLVFIFLHLPTALLNAQDRDNCQDFRVYGDDTHQNYIQLSTGSNARIIYFDEVTVRKTGNSGYLVCFPVFGIAPVMQGNENMDPVSLMRMATAEDIDHRMSKINLLISPGTDDPYYFSRSSINSIDCVIDGNRFNPSLEDLLDPQSSNMEHNIRRDGDKLIMDFTSVSKEDATFSMQLHIEAESIPEKVLEDNFRAEISGDTLKARIYLYRNAGLLTYETRFGLEKIVRLPEDGSMRSGYLDKDCTSCNGTGDTT